MMIGPPRTPNQKKDQPASQMAVFSPKAPKKLEKMGNWGGGRK